MVRDPKKPDLLEWLVSLNPREELTVRYAMRVQYPECRADEAFTARVEYLFALVSPSDQELAEIDADTQKIAPDIELLMESQKEE